MTSTLTRGWRAVSSRSGSRVLLTGPELIACWRAPAWRIQRARRDGDPVSPRLIGLERTLAAEVASLAGQASAGSSPGLPVSPEDLIDTRQAAAMLGVSPRTVRRRADELGVARLAGRFAFDRLNIAAQILKRTP